MKTAIFAGGCFWGVEESFRTTKGVIKTEAGYAGGHTPNPTYEQVCTGKTGHAEAVKVEFDPKIISYPELSNVFWQAHDPTTLNRQGPDIGSQYRSIIFYQNDQQKELAQKSKEELDNSGKLDDPIVTEIIPLDKFYPAEDYHQKYLMKRNLPSCDI